MNNQCHSFLVKNPLRQECKFNLISNREAINLLETSVSEKIMEVSNIAIKIPVFLLQNKKILVKYTSNSYAIILEDFSQVEKVIKNDSFQTITLHHKFGSDKINYCFNLHSKFIGEIIKGNIVELEHSHSNLNYRLIEFQDKSILFFMERSSMVYQGTWFPDFENFKYFLENDYL